MSQSTTELQRAKELLDSKIHEVVFASVKCTNVLRDNFLPDATFREVVGMTRRQFLALRGCGETTVEELELELERYELRLGMKPEELP